MKPTKEQENELWELCGWGYAPGLGLISPDGEDVVPPIDLNNLFKYAPALEKKEYAIFIEPICDANFSCVGVQGIFTGMKILNRVEWGDDFEERVALALFWAIYSIIKEGK